MGTFHTNNPTEITVAYSKIVLRGLSGDGEKLTATEIESPDSVCIQRCLSATDVLYFVSQEEEEEEKNRHTTFIKEL